MAKRYERQTLFQAVGGSDGRAQTAAQLAATLSEFSQRTGRFAQEMQSRRGAVAGAHVGLDGAPNLKSNNTAYGDAYNKAAIRNYTITSYADIEQSIGRMETEAAGDPEKFSALAKGYQKEKLKGTIPEARGQVAELFTRRFAEGMGKVTNEAIANQKQTNRAVLQQGIDVLTDSMSRKITSGDPAMIEEAQHEEVQLHLMLDGAVNSGDLKAHEAIVMKGEVSKAVTKQMVVGGFEATLKAPNGDPVGYIDRVMSQPAENMSDTEKQQVVGELFQRLNQHQALLRESTELDASQLKARYASGEKYATSLLLDGKLTMDKVQKLTDTDWLDPSVARTLRNELLEGGSKMDDDRERFHVETNLLRFTEEDIRDNPRLSWDTKRTLIDKRRDESLGWKSTQQAREAADRIDRALGILPGIDSRMLSDEDRRARDQALTEWYDAVDSLPEETRQAQALEMSGQIVQRVIKGNAAKEAADLERRLRNYQADKDPSKLKGAALTEYTSTVQRYQSQIDAARSKAR